MNILYRRIITMCMVSVSSLLALIYCMFSFQDTPALIVVMAVAFVASLYVLLNAYIDLKNSKDEQLKTQLDEAINAAITKLNSDDKNLELERLLKASYVQARKANSTLASTYELYNENLQSLIDELNVNNEYMLNNLNQSMTKSAKIIAKYNKNDAEKIISSINEYSKVFDTLTSQIEEVKQAISELASREVPVQIIKQEIPEMDMPIDTSEDTIDVNSFLNEFDDTTETDDTKDIEVEEATTYADEIAVIAQDDASTDLVSSIAEDPDYDPNKQLSTDEIAALFAAAGGGADSSSETVSDSTEETTEVTDEDATEDTSEDGTADVDETAVIAQEDAAADLVSSITEDPDYDPNKQLSTDEIAALFAAASGGANSSENNDEAATETEVAIEESATDPNKQLSPDEIAALFEASKAQHKANDIDDFDIHNHPESMDQGLIDALLDLDSLDDSIEAEIEALEKTTLNADVIPFPTKEINQLEEELLGEDTESSSEEENIDISTVEVAEEFDPNKQLSPDEIAALFASMSSVGEEKTIDEIDKDIAKSAEEDALIGGSADKKEEEQPAATPTPVVDDDPNRQLSPDEIAALFASMK